MYLKASTGIKISTFLEKIGGGGWGCGSRNGSLMICDQNHINYSTLLVFVYFTIHFLFFFHSVGLPDMLALYNQSTIPNCCSRSTFASFFVCISLSNEYKSSTSPTFQNQGSKVNSSSHDMQQVGGRNNIWKCMLGIIKHKHIASLTLLNILLSLDLFPWTFHE